MECAGVPGDFLRLSDAVYRLERGIWGGLPRPGPLQAIRSRDLRGGSVAFFPWTEVGGKPTFGLKWGKEEDGKLVVKPEHKKVGSVGFGPWKEEAGALLRTAAIKEKLRVFVLPVGEAIIKKYGPKPQILPSAVLKRMICRRKSLPDCVIRHSLKIAGGDLDVFNLLKNGILVVDAREFGAWYKLERSKGKAADSVSSRVDTNSQQVLPEHHLCRSTPDLLGG